MPAKIPVRSDWNAAELRNFAVRSSDAKQCRRLLSIAAILEGKSRTESARIGGMQRQILRDWVIRFNEQRPEGLINRKAAGPPHRLNSNQRDALAKIIETGPDPERDGVVRWRCVDLKHVIKEHFGVDYHVRHVGRLMHDLGFSHISTRPKHSKNNR